MSWRCVSVFWTALRRSPASACAARGSPAAAWASSPWTCRGRDNAEAAFRLEQEFGILTRCGLHCAPAAHRSLGTFPQGTIRFSLGFANTEQDVDAAVAALRAISAG